MSEWRTDMENAPDDGTHIMAWDGLGQAIVSWWIPSREDFEFDDEASFAPSPCWVSHSQEEDEFLTPTHWKPLDAPPESDQ